jgi:hypothetical protein
MDRLAEIRWQEFTHPCGFHSREIPSLLIDLNNSSEDISLRAANRLWDVVSHQGNVGSNSVPTAPFLLERLVTAATPVQVEILEILYSFACETRHSRAESWAQHLRTTLDNNVELFERFGTSSDEDIRGYAELILEVLRGSELNE